MNLEIEKAYLELDKYFLDILGPLRIEKEINVNAFEKYHLNLKKLLDLYRDKKEIDLKVFAYIFHFYELIASEAWRGGHLKSIQKKMDEQMRIIKNYMQLEENEGMKELYLSAENVIKKVNEDKNDEGRAIKIFWNKAFEYIKKQDAEIVDKRIASLIFEVFDSVIRRADLNDIKTKYNYAIAEFTNGLDKYFKSKGFNIID